MIRSLSSPARVALAALLLGLGMAAAGAGWTYRVLHRPYAAWSGPSVDVEISPGLSASQTVDLLARNGVVSHPWLVRRWIGLRGGDVEIQAGEYRFDTPASPLSVLERLRRGDVMLYPVTVPEGLDLVETAERIAAQGLVTKAALLEAFADPTAVRDLDPDASDLEGYLYPETYRFPRGITARAIAAAMVERFRKAAGEDFAHRASAAGLTVRQAVTLASLIERETSVPGERGRISRVFHNRLERGMRLQCDPTVIYALRRAGRKVSRLTYRDLEFDSEWNTYVVSGLPPGPIASPGRTSLEAAIHPAEGDELYFVASPDGGHRFSSTLDAHLEAVAAWRRYSRSSR